MIEITNIIIEWISCSNDLWQKCFKSREYGSSEFISIEAALLDVFVIEKINMELNYLNNENVFDHLLVRYKKSVQENRQLCITQKAGNVYCSTQPVAIKENADCRIKSIDTMGTMLEGKAYVEVLYEKGFILESPEYLRYFIL